MTNPTSNEDPRLGFWATVDREGFMSWRSRVYFQHPNGQSVHYSNTFPFFWFGKLVVRIIASYKTTKRSKSWEKHYGD